MEQKNLHCVGKTLEKKWKKEGFFIKKAVMITKLIINTILIKNQFFYHLKSSLANFFFELTRNTTHKNISEESCLRNDGPSFRIVNNVIIHERDAAAVFQRVR